MLVGVVRSREGVEGGRRENESREGVEKVSRVWESFTSCDSFEPSGSIANKKGRSNKPIWLCYGML